VLTLAFLCKAECGIIYIQLSSNNKTIAEFLLYGGKEVNARKSKCMNITHVKWATCHRSWCILSLWIQENAWRMFMKIGSKQSCTAHKWLSSCFGVRQEVISPHCKKTACYEMLRRILGLNRLF
jgi:hypothetical protein